ncbi:MAG: hypothetical protein ACYDCI_00165 [Candidatus Limnocylindrales bacterium]
MISIESAQHAAIRPWLVQASTAIAARLHDARAHAETGRLHSAAERLDELERTLADGVIGPARAQFYRHAFLDQKSVLDRDMIDYTVEPTSSGAIAASTAPILGEDQYQSIGELIDRAGDELKLANAVQRPDGRPRSAYHDDWERRHRTAITSAAHGALSNAQMALHNAVGQLLIRADIR